MYSLDIVEKGWKYGMCAEIDHLMENRSTCSVERLSEKNPKLARFSPKLPSLEEVGIIKA
ncbi:hypothetical protein PENTCL1PPCAC_23881 [Pristionchus entomophagus]|uniref:Uncharacterized protein n=1 Tax=Pristionchus entomophagus TaxID=358040 RepID=A0AAV5U5Q2_9BILA|nr:hypothetical protein PENTCL1PPCAC_23881 [Pristionchus entomophagus]